MIRIEHRITCQQIAVPRSPRYLLYSWNVEYLGLMAFLRRALGPGRYRHEFSQGHNNLVVLSWLHYQISLPFYIAAIAEALAAVAITPYLLQAPQDHSTWYQSHTSRTLHVSSPGAVPVAVLHSGVPAGGLEPATTPVTGPSGLLRGSGHGNFSSCGTQPDSSS